MGGRKTPLETVVRWQTVVALYCVGCLVSALRRLLGLPTSVGDGARSCHAFLRPRFYDHPDSHPLSASVTDTMSLCNHRGFADYFLDDVITCGGGYLARNLVKAAWPLWLNSYLCGKVEFFRRSGGNKDALARKISSLARHRGVVVYPEGHRQQTNRPLPMRYGAVRVAYREGIAVQCVVTRNKERVCCMQTRSAERNVPLYVYRSEHLRPKDYATIEDWCVAVKECFDAAWSKVYDADEDTEWVRVPEGTYYDKGPNGVPKRVAYVRRCVAVGLAVGWIVAKLTRLGLGNFPWSQD